MKEFVILTGIKMQEMVFEFFRPLRNEQLIYLYLIEIAPCPVPLKYSIEAAPDSPFLIDPIVGAFKDVEEGQHPFMGYLDKTAVDCSKVKLIIRFSPEERIHSTEVYSLKVVFLKNEGGSGGQKDDSLPVNYAKLSPNPKIKKTLINV